MIVLLNKINSYLNKNLNRKKTLFILLMYIWRIFVSFLTRSNSELNPIRLYLNWRFQIEPYQIFKFENVFNSIIVFVLVFMVFISQIF